MNKNRLFTHLSRMLASLFNVRLFSVFLCIISMTQSFAGVYTYVLEVGQTKTFSPGGQVYNFKQSDPSIINCTLNFISSGNGVVVTALKPGFATCDINYVTDNVGYWNTYKIEVIDVMSINIPASLNLTIGESYKFTPIVQDSRMAEYLLEWKSLDDKVAIVDSDKKTPKYNNFGQIAGYNYVRGGNLKAIGVGETQIFCTYKGIKAVCQLTVNPIYVTDITFELPSYEVNEYQSFHIDPIILPEKATNKEIVWKSTNPSVATVDQKGNITALTQGKTYITATAKDGSLTSGGFFLSVTPEVKEDHEVSLCIDDYLHLSTKVEKHAPFMLNLQPPSKDWAINSFTINNENTLDQLINGKYSISRVEKNMEIYASFEYSGSLQFYDMDGTDNKVQGVENSNILLSKIGNQLCLSNIENKSSIKIYTLGGHLIGNYISSSSKIKIDLAPNFYIVEVNEIRFKVKI